jgi:myo-inositol-1(or 4)-monophosphatase
MILQVMLEAAEAGAEQLRKYFGQSYQISNKEGLNNLVTEADHASERVIVETIRRYFSDHSILGEEGGALQNAGSFKWIIDPIDGTINFANNIPICCVSIGVEHEGKMVAGVVFNPFMHELFIAEKGKGATLNGSKIYVSTQPQVEKSCLVTGFPYTYLDQPNGPLEVFERLIRKGIPVRRLGSAAIDLCWVAAGRFDGFYEHHLQPWDSAAGFLIVEEAGGKVTNFEGKEFSPYQPKIVATNGVIHNELLQWIQGTITS